MEVKAKRPFWWQGVRKTNDVFIIGERDAKMLMERNLVEEIKPALATPELSVYNVIEAETKELKIKRTRKPKKK